MNVTIITAHPDVVGLSGEISRADMQKLSRILAAAAAGCADVRVVVEAPAAPAPADDAAPVDADAE